MADASRKAELERKKAKLLAIREAKIQKQLEKQKELDSEIAAKASPKTDIRSQADAVLAELGLATTTDLLNTPPSSLSSEQLSSSLSLNEPSATNSLCSISTSKAPTKKKPQLTVVSVHQTNIPPKEQVTYNKQTQTATTTTEREAHPLDYYVLVYDDVDEDESSSLPTMESSPPNGFTGSRPPGGHGGMPHVELVKPATTPAEEAAAKIIAEEKIIKPREMSEEEKHKVMLSDNFVRFFDRSSRIIERALAEEDNSGIFLDYSGIEGEEKESDDKQSTRLSLNRDFYDERWCKGRMVTSLHWSTQFPELVVASYDKNEDSPHDPDGVALVWNLKFKKTTPEYIFHCQSAVTSATFATFHPSLLIGGTYSGQIVLWDNRVHKRTPIQRSPLSSQAHTHPIYCMKVVGTQNAHNLVSISTDGKFCTWSLDMLSQPQDSMELQHKQAKAVAATSLSFPVGDVNNFIVGSEECNVYAACRHGSRAGVTDVFEGHQGPVTAVNSHEAQGQIDFSNLFLTSSFDWTVKLWSLKENKPLYSFEDYGDYVTDVGWSPIHPALFASVDGTGRLDVWNLNNDAEASTSSVIVDGSPALSRVSWSQSGHQLVAGDRNGKLWVYDVGEQLAAPKANEWTQLAHTLQELKNNQADENIDNLSNPGLIIR